MKRKYLAAGIIVSVLLITLIVYRNTYLSADHPAGKDAEERAHREGAEEPHDIITMDEESIRLSRIETGPASSGTIEIKKVFSGEVRLNEDQLARVIPRFSGVVRNVYATAGKDVRKGQPLMQIESNESLTVYEVKSPIAGTVIEKNVIVGSKADIDSESFLIADLKTVWVDLGIYAADLAFVTKGQAATISSPGTAKAVIGLITYVNPIINGQSRTATARVVIDNSSGDWAPGTFVTASIAIEKESAEVVIADSAIQAIDGRPSVFIRTDDGFRVQPVTIGKSDGDHVQILSGLGAGTVIAIGNSFVLKAELGKGEADHH